MGVVRSMWNGLVNSPRGFMRLNQGGIGAVLLDLFLPDSQGIETFDKLFIAASDVPILILGGNGNEALAKEALMYGAVMRQSLEDVECCGFWML
jgi:FixJ family two-component response regulator